MILLKVKNLEERLQRHIIKSRPYFDEKFLCQDQLNTQKDRIETIKKDIAKAKHLYAQTLRTLEQISNEIHMKRNGLNTAESDILNGPREPGVGAELTSTPEEIEDAKTSLPDFNLELDKCEIHSMGTLSGNCSSRVSEQDENEVLDDDLDELKQKFKELAVRPVNGGEGKSTDGVWESELKNTVDKLDHMMLMQECAKELDQFKSELNNAPAKKIAEKTSDVLNG